MDRSWGFILAQQPYKKALGCFCITALLKENIEHSTIFVYRSPEILLHLCGDDARWTNEAAAMDPTQSIGQTPEAQALRFIADDLQTLLKREAPELERVPGFWLAQLHTRTAVGLLRYHANMATPSPKRVSHMLALRDLMMADTLIALVSREKTRGPTLVFAHNAHLQRHRAQVRTPTMNAAWWSAGAHMTARMGEQYAFIAATLGSGAGLGEPAPDTLEGYLSQLTTSPTLYVSRQLVSRLPGTLKKRMNTSYAFQPLHPGFLNQTDGVLFVPTTQQ